MPKQTKQNNQNIENVSPLEKVFPDFTSKQLEEAEYTLHQYIRIVRRIFERIKRERPEILTELKKRARLRKQRQAIKKSP